MLQYSPKIKTCICWEYVFLLCDHIKDVGPSVEDLNLGSIEPFACWGEYSVMY